MKILTYPDASLREKTKEVTKIDFNFELTVSRMCEIVMVEKALGLAANQVGWDQSVFVTNANAKGIHDAEEFDIHCYINPIIKARQKEKVTTTESCLSLSEHVEVTRSKKILLSWFDIDGKEHEEWFEGIDSIIVQHEFDHLQGKLIIDHKPKKKRKRK